MRNSKLVKALKEKGIFREGDVRDELPSFENGVEIDVEIEKEEFEKIIGFDLEGRWVIANLFIGRDSGEYVGVVNVRIQGLRNAYVMLAGKELERRMLMNIPEEIVWDDERPEWERREDAEWAKVDLEWGDR